MSEPEQELASIDWNGREGTLLASLRERFLSGRPLDDYWENASTLELYDRTFGTRIRWKWEWVLARAESRLRGPAAEHLLGRAGPRTVVDLGTGTGAAVRAFFERYPPGPGDRALLFDRSRQAAAFAAQKLGEETAAAGRALEIESCDQPPKGTGHIVLISHLLAELEPAQLEGLMPLLEAARALLIVEPGTQQAAGKLVALRERLAPKLGAIYPCPSTGPCPLAGAPDDWCHLYAPPAVIAFTSNHWRRFSERLGIDLRSLPLSTLVLLDQQDLPEVAESGLGRVLGRPRLEKGRVLLDLCQPGHYSRVRLLDRDARGLVKRLSGKHPYHPLLQVEIAGDRLISAVEIDAEELEPGA